MGLFSSSKKETSTFNTSQTGEVDGGIGIGAQDASSLAVSNVTGGASLTVNESSLDARGAVDLINAVSGASRETVATTAQALKDSTASDIAKSTTGTESETGRILNQSMLPILLVVGGFLFLNRK